MPTPSITLTDKAKEMIKEISDAEGIGHYSVRVKVLGGGCAGMTHDMIFEDKISKMDNVFSFDDVKVIIDMMSFEYLEGTEIDYLDGSMGAGFKFINPNVNKSCGCGSSFSM